MVIDKLKSIYLFFKRKWTINALKESAPAITKERITSDLKKLGLESGDTVLVHSSLKRIGYVIGGAKTVIEALIDAVSPDGTLVIPTYHMNPGGMYATCKQYKYIFDVRTSDTFLGFIPAEFLKYPGIERSIHPTHSVSAIGKHAKYITEAHHKASSTFGTDSPWDRIVKLNGKGLGIGVSLAPIPLYHMLEDMRPDEFPLPVKIKETYQLDCIDRDGKPIKVPINPHDPVVAKTRIDKEENEFIRAYFWEEFKNAGVIKTGKIGEATSWLTSTPEFYKHLEELMRKGITIYSTPNQL
jgi:aminoglycoside N3'-acetyltransferase